MLFHGYWNLSAEGTTWWAEQNEYPAFFRWPVGVIEIVGAVGLGHRKLSRWVGVCFLLLMLGAIREHWPMGYSFKTNGFEVPLVYAVLSAVFVFE
jgi:uncharacterized membrane protein YphA (DoxX/SURF4 family)